MTSKNDNDIENDVNSTSLYKIFSKKLDHNNNNLGINDDDDDVNKSNETIMNNEAQLLSPSNELIMKKYEKIYQNEYNKAITPKLKRIFILISTLFETIIFSGLIFGWPSLFYMLKNEEIYSHLCVNINFDDKIPITKIIKKEDFFNNFTIDDIMNNDKNITNIIPIEKINSCIPQENILNLAYTISIFSMGFTSFAWGFLLESKGLRFVRKALNILIILGCLLLSMTNSDISVQIIPAIIILGLVGVPLRIANMQIADFFPLKRSTIISLYSGAFSSSPVVFVLIKYAYDDWSLSYFNSTIILFIISATLLPLNTFLLPKLSVRSRERTLLKRFNEYRFKVNALDMELNKEKPHFVKKKLLKTVSDRFNLLDNVQPLISNDNLNNKKPIIVNFNEYQQHKNERKSNIFKRMFKPAKVVNNEIPLRVSLFSISFLMHQLWFSWINTYMVLYSGSMALWLDRVTKDDYSKKEFTQTFGLVQVSALVIAPLAGLIMDIIVRQAQNAQDDNHRQLIQAQSGFGPILFTTLTLVGAVACRFFDTSLSVYLSIAFITILRSLFIAVASAYLRVRYPASHFNRLNGIMCTSGAFFSLLQFPLFYFESKSNLGAFWVNVFCAIMTLVSLLNPLSLRIGSLQRHLIRKEEQHGKHILDSKEQRLEIDKQTLKTPGTEIMNGSNN